MRLYQFNNIPLLLDLNQRSKLSHIIIYSKIGSRSEEKSGITHFLEHCIFKGSKKYRYFEISEFFELYGNSIDASTNKESLIIYTSVLNEKLFRALDIFFDIILNPTFEDYEKEKNVIIQEYKESLDDSEEMSYYYLNKAIFKNHPLSRNILGTPSNIRKFSKDDLIKRKNEVFSKDNVILLISGNFKEEELLKFIKDNFYLEFEYEGNLKTFKNYKPSRIEKRYYNGLNSYVTMGIPIFGYQNFRMHLMLLSQMLGGGASSILFDEIRERNGLLYDIHTSLDFYNEVAVFSIAYNVEKKSYEKVILEIKRVLENLEDYLVNFDKFKQKFKTSITIDFESHPNYLFYALGEYLFSNKILTKDELLNKVESMNLNEFLDMIEVVKDFENYSFGIVF